MILPVTADDPRLEAFHAGLYRGAFADQLEPLAVWQRALRGELPYELAIDLWLDREHILGGIAYERYPQSGCGLVTYMVVAEHARRVGIGKQLQARAAQHLFARGVQAVLGELDDPRIRSGEPARIAWLRVLRNQRWGARVIAAPYVQPALAPGLRRDRGLLLVALAGTDPLPAVLDGGLLRRFVEELYEVTEHGPPDDAIAFPELVALVELVADVG